VRNRGEGVGACAQTGTVARRDPTTTGAPKGG
jgi:hypothetical protein